MIESSTRRTPMPSTVWKEQLRITGLAVRRECIAALAVLALVGLVGAIALRTPEFAAFLDMDGIVDPKLDPGAAGFSLWGVFAGLLLPLLVWRGERPYGDTPLWSLPVDHRAHSLTKVAAGWVWLMALVGSALLVVLIAVAVGGASLGTDEVRVLILDRAGYATGAPDAARSVAWSTPWWEWVLPFTSATAAYLLSSALLLGTPHPFRWAVAIWAVVLVMGGAVEFLENERLYRGFSVLAWFAGLEDFAGGVRLASGEFARGWWRIPTLGMWVGMATLWIGLGTAGVLAASARRRDH